MRGLSPAIATQLQQDLLGRLPPAGTAMRLVELLSKYVRDPSGYGLSNARAAVLELAGRGDLVLDNAGNVSRPGGGEQCAGEVPWEHQERQAYSYQPSLCDITDLRQAVQVLAKRVVKLEQQVREIKRELSSAELSSPPPDR